ncbi:AraC family transcriptional regulator [Marinomonas sp. C2222]|uniref:AraC family transcriptional regulator n=1 Tax=Marinomonas sargassi TaxID=2984494 RepID=A0ABT2YU31_9GAMM|nr:AraC family transcriptional regulator [Marinomonas sargassi]MCV2403404.1 AraC family transcriptional regulator [Marinomonas sargassi]
MIRHFQYKKVCAGRDYLQEHYKDEFSLSKVAEHSCMSQYHFSRVFTSVFGESPNAFVARLRIEKAKQLLVTEGSSISEICTEVGYSSIGSFSSLFSEKVGMSPSQYRRQLSSLANEPHRFPMQSIPLCFAQNLFGFKANEPKK